MLQLINKLIELADRIGNGASVALYCRKKSDGSHGFIFRVDWPCKSKFYSDEVDYALLVQYPNEIVDALADEAIINLQKENMKKC